LVAFPTPNEFRKLRNYLGYSLRDVASETGVSPAVICAFERDKTIWYTKYIPLAKWYTENLKENGK
jgi:transcriptional regulator with XRE-family HTH domain